MKIKSIKINAIMNIALTMSSFIFQIVSFPYASRILHPDGVGKSTFATSLIAYFVIFAQLGIPTYGVVTCAKLRNDKKKLSQTVQELLIINLIMSMIVYLVLICSIMLVPKLSSDMELYFIASTTIILNTIGIEWMYRGLEQYSYITVRSVLFKFIALGLMMMFVKNKDDYIIYTGITVLATSGSQICNLLYAKKFVDLNFVKFDHDVKKHLKPVLVFFMMSCATTIYTHMDAVMLGIMKTDEIVGYYNAATKIKSFLVAIVTSLGTVLLPRTSFYIKNGEYEKFNEICSRVLKIIFIIGMAVSLYFFFFAEDSVFFLSGIQYKKSILPMRVIMPTVLFIGLTNVIGIQMLIPLGKEKLVLLSELVGAMVNLVVNICFIPKYGATGAAIGTLCAEFAVLIIQMNCVQGNLRMAFKDFKFVEFLVVLIIAIFISRFVIELKLTSFFTLLVSAIIYYGIVFAWTWKRGIIREVLGK